MEMAFQWKDGSRIFGISAQIAGTELMKLRQAGALSAQRLVDVSRDETAPLHNAFEWDDAVAGEEWRKCQARHVINSLVIKESCNGEPKETRLFVSLSGSDGGYETIHTVLQSPIMRETMLRDALRELSAFRRKYAALKEFAEVFAAIENATFHGTSDGSLAATGDLEAVP